jgi:hypothetical protein
MEKDFKIDLVTGASRRKNLQEWLPLGGLVISSVIVIFQIFAVTARMDCLFRLAWKSDGDMDLPTPHPKPSMTAAT